MCKAHASVPVTLQRLHFLTILDYQWQRLSINHTYLVDRYIFKLWDHTHICQSSFFCARLRLLWIALWQRPSSRDCADLMTECLWGVRSEAGRQLEHLHGQHTEFRERGLHYFPCLPLPQRMLTPWIPSPAMPFQTSMSHFCLSSLRGSCASVSLCEFS